MMGRATYIRHRMAPAESAAGRCAAVIAFFIAAPLALAQPPEQGTNAPVKPEDGGVVAGPDAATGRTIDGRDAGDEPLADAEDLRTALSREIARLRADIAEIGRFSRWQADVMRIARTDRAEALRQRLPMADCRASALAPLCDELTGLFMKENADEEAPVNREDAP